MKRRPTELGADAQAKILRRSRERGEDNQLLLLRYANERLLYRLAQSRHASTFVLKGAALFTVWTGEPHRATRDIDLLGYGEPSEARMGSIFREVTAAHVHDGVVFDTDTLTVGPIRAMQEYGGIRIGVVAHIGTARVKLQVDIGFGDAITPAASEATFPTLLDDPAPVLQAYPRETVVAEKLEAVVHLGAANSRMKDFYDLAIMSELFSFSGDSLVGAITATFQRRLTPLPTTPPVALLQSFIADRDKLSQWRAFMRRAETGVERSLEETLNQVERFATPVLEKALHGTRWSGVWPPRGPWQEGTG